MSGLANPAKYLLDFFRGMMGSSEDYEQKLTAEACLKYAPVWYAVSRISGHIGQLPTVLHERMNGGAAPAVDHPAFSLLKKRPNEYQNACIFKQTMMSQALLYGNARALIVRKSNRPAELLPLDPCRSDTLMSGGEKWHVTVLNPEIDGIPKRQGMPYEEAGLPNAWAFPDKDVLHVMGLSLDGFKGLPLSEYASRSLGLGTNLEKSAAKQSTKGFHGSLMLEAPPGAFRSEEQAKEFLSKFREQHAGSDNAGAIGMLREGVKANVMAMTGRDMQAIESRQFQRQDVALWFLLEHITGDNSATSYNSLSERNLAYLSNCLGRWIKVWEEECDEKLLLLREKNNDSHFFRFSTGALLKQDMQTTATTLSTFITAMILTPNEARAVIDYNPIAGGDELINPATTSTTGIQPPEETDTASDQSDSQLATVNRAIQSRIRHMLGIEKKRILDASKSPDFVDRAEAFYARWESSLADVCEELGLDRQLAASHCTESKRRLVEAMQTKSDIELLVANWELRSENFAAGTGADMGRSGNFEMSEMFRLLATTIAATSQREPVQITVQPAAPVIDVHVPELRQPEIIVSVPEQPAPVINVAPAEIILPELNPVINVAAPAVNVVNEVQPAPVELTGLPARRTSTTVIRDRDGRITGSEQIEEDA